MTTVETPSNVVVTTTPDHPLRRLPAWGAIFAGVAAGLAVHLLFSMLGSAVGLGTADPITEDHPIASIGIKSAIIWTVSALIALWSGAWVAGWFSGRNKASGCLHGFLVWSMATIGIIALVGTGMGAAVGGAVNLFGRGMSAVAKPAAAAAGGVADIAKDALQKNSTALSSYVDEILAAPTARNLNQPRARREIGAALAGLFGPDQDVNSPEARTAVTRALVNTGGISEADANRMLNEWTDSYNRMKAQWDAAKEKAELKAREVADKSAKALAAAALIGFIGFGLGAFVSMDGGKRGALRSINYELDRVTHT